MTQETLTPKQQEVLQQLKGKLQELGFSEEDIKTDVDGVHLIKAEEDYYLGRRLIWISFIENPPVMRGREQFEAVVTVASLRESYRSHDLSGVIWWYKRHMRRYPYRPKQRR